MTLKRLTGIIGIAGRWFPTRRAAKAPPKPKPFEYSRAEQIGGEWWVLASDGARFIPCGSDEARAQEIASTINARVNNAGTSLQLAKRNRALIAARVREIGGMR